MHRSFCGAEIDIENIELPEKIDINLIEALLKKLTDFLPTLGSALLILVIGMLIRKITLSVMKKAVSKSRLDKTVHSFLISAVNVLLIAFILIIVLSVLGIPTASIIAVFSAAGLAIGLALQNSLSNVAGGFIILLSDPFKAGDYISAAGSEGTVEEITILTTKIKTPDNKDIYIPNGTLSGATITNYTREKMRRVDMIFGISYSSDSAAAIEIINGILDAHKLTLSDPAPTVRIISLSESSVDITVRVWVHSDDYWTVYFDLTEQIKAAFDENGIEIPFRNITIHSSAE